MKKKKEEEFDFLHPDKNRLDEEWVNQPKLYFDWACQLADARECFDETKADLDLVRAEADKEIRSNPEKYGIAKVTEAVISNVIIQQDEYKDALSSMSEVRHRLGILQAAVAALDHRKSALERLVSLHGQNYFSTPQADESSKEVTDNYEKKAVRGKRRRREGEI